MLRMSLLPKTQFPWILCHQTTLCHDEIVIYQMNTMRKLTLIISWLRYWDNSENLKTNSPAWNPPLPTVELVQLTNKLYDLTIMLQQHPTLLPNEEPMHKTMQAYTDTLHATQTEANLTMTLLQDISTFDGQDSSKLEDWFMDIETATDILTENCTCLAEAKSHSLTHTLICKALQAGKCWDKIKGILRLKLWNANIHTYTSCFMEI